MKSTQLPVGKQSLAKKELKDGLYYRGDCRNSDVAVWDAKFEVFWYMRTKFTDTFAEWICHPEDDNGYDLFFAFKECEPKSYQKVNVSLARLDEARSLENELKRRLKKRQKNEKC